ncbi:hypothetical protein BKA64DRAFT_653068 [Cadophora sp. MPI-SDFR-AT-0126]|nr:hypothetical protein BKA64DRAFT_653068 [Leotiomycetes sp. MPI-SDFR-AT-0126]
MYNQRKAKRCSTCATRKIACDMKHPACSQCLLTGRECPGYHQDHVFLQHSISRSSSGKPKVTTLKKSRDTLNKTVSRKPLVGSFVSTTSHRSAVKYTLSTRPESPTSRDDILIQTIIENFTPFHEIGLINVGDKSAVSLNSRMCGAWVTLLPDLFAQSAAEAGVLCIATRALGTAISGRTNRDAGLISEALDLVCGGLQALRAVLGEPQNVCDVEVLAASMCFNITEVLLGTSHDGWSVHVQGIAELIRDRGPSSFVTGTAHHLFTSFRIFMLLEYMQKRKSVFLTEADWLRVPFSMEPKSSMQTLLDVASPLPGLLEKLDELSENRPAVQSSSVDEIIKELDNVQLSLQKWEADLKSAHDGPLWWPVSSAEYKRSPSHENELVFPISSQFPNILTANTMTHYWAFVAITNSTIARLCHFPTRTPSPQQPRSRKRKPDDLLTLASNICASMAYHMHPSQKLYGPASTFFPLWIALQIFQRDTSSDSRRKEVWCRNLIMELEERGLPLAGYLVGCPGI